MRLHLTNGGFPHWLTGWSATRPRATSARMSSAIAVETNGLGSSWAAGYSLIFGDEVGGRSRIVGGEVLLILAMRSGDGVEHGAA